jgi:parvulin-like peptidyl-prolyl isomerase
MRSLRLLLAPLALASPFASGCGHDRPSVPRSAIAVVGKRTITRAQFEELMSQARLSYARRGRAFPAAGTNEHAELKATAVRLLVEQAELEQKAPDLGVSIDPRQVTARRQLLIDETFGGSEARYRARLREERMTDAQIRSALRAQLLSNAVFQAVTADVTVDTSAAQRYYESHLSSYSRPRTRAVRHILVGTRTVAERLYAHLRAGESFAALARRFSRDARTRARGGRLVLVEGRTAAGLDRTAFSLRAGTVSRPFKTSFGWEIVQALSPVRPGRATPFAAVRESIRRRLLVQERQHRFARWLAAVRAEFASKTGYAEGFGPANVG